MEYQEAHLTLDALHAFLAALQQFGPQGNEVSLRDAARLC
jgi:hypothetical protein